MVREGGREGGRDKQDARVQVSTFGHRFGEGRKERATEGGKGGGGGTEEKLRGDRPISILEDYSSLSGPGI